MSKLRDLLATASTAPVAPVAPAPQTATTMSTLLAAARASKQQIDHAPTAPTAPDLLDVNAVGAIVLDCTTDPADWPKQLIVEQTDQLPEKLAQLLEQLHAALGTDEIDTVLTQTAGFIAANAGTADILLPSQIQLIVRACRIAHGTVIARKTEKRDARTSKKQATIDLANELTSLGFSLKM